MKIFLLLLNNRAWTSRLRIPSVMLSRVNDEFIGVYKTEDAGSPPLAHSL